MDRKEFFKLIEREYFTVQEGHNIATKEYVNFDVESTELSIMLLDSKMRKEFFDFLVYEKERDNWCFLSEEFAGCFMQMLSTNQSVSGIDIHVINSIEGFYYKLLEGLLMIAGSVEVDPETAKTVYVNHMEDLRALMVSIMDIEELKTHA